MAAGEVQGEHRRREVSRCRSWKDLLKKKREKREQKRKRRRNKRTRKTP